MLERSLQDVTAELGRRTWEVRGERYVFQQIKIFSNNHDCPCVPALAQLEVSLKSSQTDWVRCLTEMAGAFGCKCPVLPKGLRVMVYTPIRHPNTDIRSSSNPEGGTYP